MYRPYWYLAEFLLRYDQYLRRSVEMRGEAKKLSDHRHLKVVEFVGFWAERWEVELAVYIAENVPGLEKMVLDSTCPFIGKSEGALNPKMAKKPAI